MRRSTRQAWTWGSVAAVIVGLIVWAAMNSHGAASGSVPPVTTADHVRGSTTAKAVLIEYGDFQCPACGQFEPIVRQLHDHYGDRLEIVFREYPLLQVHQYALTAAHAAEAANLQGKFWEFHDLLYDRQASWSDSLDAKATMIDYAKELGLDVKKFTADIDSSGVKDRVQRDIDSGNAANLPGTPTFFLNGSQISNPSSFDAFTSIIDHALAA